MNVPHNDLLDPTLPMPGSDIETPCFVVVEDAVEHNLRVTAELAGGVHRMVPHVKTHRSPWIAKFLVANGVTAFKTATPREVEMVLEGGAKEVIWSYPTTSSAAITRVIKAADAYPEALVTGLVDTELGLDLWIKALAYGKHPNVSLRVDIDPGMGRTGVEIGEPALALARKVQQCAKFNGWHVYDGHIQDAQAAAREARFLTILEQLNCMLAQAEKEGLSTDVVGGGSWTFPFWAKHSNARVSPGSWIYSSSQHQVDLAHYGWRVGAFVVSSVLSAHGETLTLDAGSKAIAPDIPMDKRFFGVERIVGMKEEHTIAAAPNLTPGDRVALVPRHACTTAYLYRRALVLTKDGTWEYRDQLGCER
ncbi:3-hydroxy-D-aspartate aldolase [Caballeronia glebae]|uniref:3-hydroxy-D-aspartate aldolase n=1 Tax=Caballeronia glebae TaxID=1777143 RepID=A0A158AZ95_9BURK|nr:alanine racemase [Caballeronia glebae]SAK63154.1 3-hydroxy-D-aspartate aldolase [Caballeronia glebae]